MGKSLKTKANPRVDAPSNPDFKGKKKRDWNSYLKEFLMLFLAIVLGFFVENPGILCGTEKCRCARSVHAGGFKTRS